MGIGFADECETHSRARFARFNCAASHPKWDSPRKGWV